MKKFPQTLFLIVIAGLSLNAHALCVNQDGSLDDPSMSPSTVSMDMLAACEDQTPKLRPPVPESTTMKHIDPASTEADIHAKAVDTNRI